MTTCFFPRRVGATLPRGIGAALILTATAAPAADTLPLKRVRFYETGVGYFERSGRLAAGDTTLPVPAGHLDDALKTLVVIGKSGDASVSGVEFGSSVSRALGRALAGVDAEATAPIGWQSLVEGLQGAPVVVETSAGAFRGRLVDVVDAAQSDVERCVPGVQPVEGDGGDRAQRTEPGACVLRKQAVLVLVGSGAEVRRFAADEVKSVKPSDPAIARRLAASLDALGRRGSAAERKLRVAARGGEVTLGYVAEAPVWRTTYRLVLDPAGDRAALQGWALVHNDTDDDWKRVSVELVNGRPDSFLYPLAAPRYARRELVTPEEQLATVPQLLGQTADDLWEGDAAAAGGLALSGIGEGGGGYGHGSGLGRIGTTGHGAGFGSSGVASSSVVQMGSLAAIAQADGVEAGALFRYALATPLDLRARGSALVPFAQMSLPARRVAWLARPGATARSAVRLAHDGTQTLPAGTLGVFADGGFAGETTLARTKPGEQRLLGFGADQDVDVAVERTAATEHPRVLAFSDEQLVEHFVRRRELRWVVTNRSSSARTVYVDLDAVDNAKVDGADALDYDAERGVALVVFDAEPRSARTRDFSVEEGLRRARPFGSLTSRHLRELAGSDALSAKTRALLVEAADLLLEAEKRRAAMRLRAADVPELLRDASRLREHVRALGGAREQAAALVERLVAAERAVASARRRARELRVEAELREADARRLLRRLGPERA